MVCHEGYWTECREQVLPIPETGSLLCDGIDNNCDGCRDGSIEEDVCIPVEENNVDVLVIMDQSGSMGGFCNSVKDAMERLGSRFGSNKYHFSLVCMPDVRNICEPGIHINFSRFFDFQEALLAITCNISGNEPSQDAAYMAASGAEFYNANTLDMSPLYWRADAIRVIIMFTDEFPQSYDRVNGICRMVDMDEATMCSVFDIEVFAVVTDPSYFPLYDECAFTYDIFLDGAGTATNLEDILEQACAD